LSEIGFQFCYVADDLPAKKTRLKQWAKMVACMVRQTSPSFASSSSKPID